MNQSQSRALGRLLKEKRLALGYSTYQLAKAAGVSDSTVVRMEQGRFKAPRPDKLVRFAELLGVPTADVFARAGYLLPSELPTFPVYLATKYAMLPRRAISELTRHFNHLLDLYQRSSR